MAHTSLLVELNLRFNGLATHFNISMFGHQTMLNDVWSPNISHLDRPHSSVEAKLVKSIRNESFNALY